MSEMLHLLRCGVLVVALAVLPAAVLAASDGIAVVIGNQRYAGTLPVAPMAERDAARVRDFLVRVQGLSGDRLIELHDADRADMARVFAPGGRLARLVRPGDSDIFVYYAGHGVPGEDGGPALLGRNGGRYALSTMLARLAELPARRVTVVLEAGFSGVSNAGPVQEPATPTALPPAGALPRHMALLAAADAGQVAGWSIDPAGSLFTNALLAALSGAADADGDKDGRTTVAEVAAFLSDSLPVTSMQLLRREQHAVLRGASDWVLVGKGPVLVPAGGEATVVTNASLRAKPTSASNRLEVLAPGARLTLLARGRDRAWLRVRWREVEGFIFAPLVEVDADGDVRTAEMPPVPAKAPPPPTVVEPRQGEMLLLSDQSLRAGPGDDDAVVQPLKAGTRLRLTGAAASGARMRVRLDSGQVGFLPAAELTPALADDLGLADALDRLRAGLGQYGSAQAVTAAAALDDELITEVYERISADFVVSVPQGRLIDGLAVGLYRGARAEPAELNSTSLTRAAIDGMINSLDRHSGYLDAKQYRDMQVQVRGEFAGLGIEVTMENDRVKVVAPIDHTPAARAGVKAGDLISHLDGESVAGLSLPQAVARMRGPVGTSIVLTIERDGGAPFDITLVRDVVRIQAVRWQVRDDVGYVRLTTFNENVDDDVRAALADIQQRLGPTTRGIVLDLRNNPGGLLKQAVAVSDVFLEQGEIVSLRGRAAGDTWRYRATHGDAAEGRPVVVLINAGSASASEIVAAALQDHSRAVVAGVTSFGKGSVQTIIPLRNRGALRLTTARYYRPSGVDIDHEGVHPDVELDTDGLEVTDVIDRARRLFQMQSATPAPARTPQ
jgi:C-terminal peptidase prc